MSAFARLSPERRAAFEAMRAGLVARGLIRADDFGLTEAGNTHVRALIDELASAEAPADPIGAGVRWNTKPRMAA